MKFLALQRQKYGKDGKEKYVIPVMQTKDRKFGPVVDREVLRRTNSIVFTGAHASGKTRMLQRLFDESHDIWGRTKGNKKTHALLFSATLPLAAWCAADGIAAWYDKKIPLDANGKPTEKPFAKLAQWDKCTAMVSHIRETGAVLMIDDCHKLAGRKLQVARDCIDASRIFVMTCDDENRLAPNLRAVVLKRNPQIVRMSSDVAYDASGILFWMLAAILVVTGAWEAGALVAGLRVLATGRRAAKQEG